jgi:hypothetical protein
MHKHKKPQIDLAKVDITSLLDVVSSVQASLVKSGKSYHATVFLQKALSADNGAEVVEIAKNYVDFAYPSFNVPHIENMFDIMGDDDDDHDEFENGDVDEDDLNRP